MHSLKLNFARIAFAVLALTVAFGAPASAATSRFQILLNLDNNITTGCNVTTLTGMFPGVEQILITTVDTTGSSAQVSAVETRACTAPPSTFGPATPIPAVPGHPLPWPVGVSNGTGGTSVIETFYPLSVAPIGPSPIIRLGVLGFDSTGTLVDEMVQAQPGPGNGPPILLQIQGVTIGEIPTLSQWGLVLLALMLAGMAVVLMKRRTRAAFLVALFLLAGAGLAWAAACDLNGTTTAEWIPSTQLATDTSDAAPGADLRAFYGCRDAGLNGICFRIDALLVFDDAPTVTTVTPADLATGVPVDSNVTVNFSETVNVTASAFSLECPVGSPVAFTVAPAPPGGANSFTLDPTANLPAGVTCTVRVTASQVTDTDPDDPPDQMAADFTSTFTTDGAPAVSSTTPADGSTGLALDQNLTITFNKPVNVAGNWFQIVCSVSGTRNVADTVVSGGPTMFTVNPNADFAVGDNCIATIFAAQVTDQDANDPPDNMAADYVFTFATDTPPAVTATVPVNSAAGVATNTNLTINFSEPVNVAGNWFQAVCTVSGTRNVLDTVVSGGPSSFTIDPIVDFTAGETCTVTVSAAQVTDQDAGDPPNNMAADFVFSFTMDTAPAVSATVPVNGGTATPASDLSVTFNEPVDVTGNWFQIVCSLSGTRDVVDTVVTGGPTAFTINPNTDFAGGDSCTVTVFAAQVADQDAGDPPNNMAANFVFSFAADAAPSVSSTVPADNATNVADNTDLSITFSEPVNVTGNWFQIVCSLSGTSNVADTVVTGGPTAFTVNPNTNFSAGENCTVTVFAAQVADQDANDPPDNMVANYVFDYTIQDVAPTVTATVPADGANNAATDGNLTITFSEPVNVTGNWFQIVCSVTGTRNVADTVVSGGPTVFTINPTVDFAGGESCTVTVFAAQVADQDVTDPPDNMAVNYVFSYSTDAAPTVSSTTPAAGAVNQPTDTNVSVMFSEPVNVTGNWFQIVCTVTGTRNVVDTAVSGGPMTFTINPNVDFAQAESCTLTVFAAQVADQDANDPPDTMAANFTATFSMDAAPAVASTVPVNGATNASTNMDVTVTFTESVNVTGNWFQIVCSLSGTRNVVDTAVSGGPMIFTINPNVDFSPGDSCTLTVFAAQVSDQDANDPPDTMLANFSSTFSTDVPPAVASTVPANGATVAIDTDLTINFSEPVNVTGNWFQIVCSLSGTRNVADTAVSGGPMIFTVNPNTDLTPGDSCTLTVFAALVTDQDLADPPDNMAANYVTAFTADLAPTVASTVPVNGALGAAPNTDLTITFSEAVNVTGNWFQIVCSVTGTRNVADTVVSGGPTSFTVNPNVDFVGNETCTVTVFAAQVTDQDANDPPNNMAANYVFSFQTDSAPSVMASTPPNGAVDQATNVHLTVTFSEPVNVTGNWFQIVCASSGTRNVTDTVVSGGPMVFTINPNVDFATNESCTLTVFAAQVTDVDANDPPDNMLANYTATFSTDAAPTVLNTTPTGNDQPSNTDLTVKFSEPVNLAGNWIQVVCSLSGTRNATDTVVTGGPTDFTVNPNVDFTPGDSCTATVFAAQVSDQDANDPPNNPVANYVWNFTIDAQPTVTATTPTNGTTQVATDTSLSVTFSEPVNVSGNWFQIVCSLSGTRNVADTVVSGGPTAFSINPNVDFTQSESCTVTVFAAQISDVDANDPPDNLPANYVFSYTLDAAPSVSSTTPANGAINQANNTNVSITFSEPVNVAGNWFQISCTVSGLRNVAATVVSGGPTTFTINPNVDFTGNETCTVTVSAAQVTDQDLGDPPNNMAADYVFSFTIINTPPMGNPDAWEFIGNTQLQVGNSDTLTEPHVFVNGDVLANDVDNDGPSPKAVSGIVACGDVTAPFVCPTANGGSVSMETTGRFVYSAKEGDVATTDSFQYTLTDGAASANATVTLNRKERVWYVRNNSTAGGLGRSHDPFDTLAEAQTASLANDYIFVYFGDGTTTGQAVGIVLKSGQHLIGHHAGLTVAVPGPGTFNGTPLPTTVSLVTAAPGNRPLVDNPGAGANTVSATDAIPVEIVGLSLRSTNANAIDLTNAVAIPANATLSIQDNVVRGAGAEGIDINLNAGTTGTLTLNVTGNTWDLAGTHTGNGFDARTAAAAANLRLNFSNNTSILSTGAGASGVFIDGSGGGTLTITGFANNSVHQNTVGNGMLITSAKFDSNAATAAYDQVSGGATVIGASGNGVGGAGISMSTVSGDLAFTDLDIFADGGQGLRVVGTGAVDTGAGTGTRVTVGAGVAIFEATGGPAVDVSNATVDLQPTSIRSTNSPTTGVSLVNVADGTTTAVFSAGSSSTITNATGTDFNLDGGNATVSYAGPINNTAGRSVVVQNRTADSATFTGAITDTGTGVFLNSNTGSTISFSGAISLTTGANAAFTATGGGTVSATNTTSTITTTTGTALNVANTTIGASGLRFRSISANGATNGIVLNNTGRERRLDGDW